MMLFLFLGHALAVPELPEWPSVGTTAPRECPRSVGITAGQPIPSVLSVEGSLSRCSFVAEPPSSFAYLLAVESHARHIEQRYRLDVRELELERDRWRARSERLSVWYRRPWFVAVTSSILVSSAFVAYSQSIGGR